MNASPDEQHTKQRILETIAALYDSISFPPGGKPDWARLRSLMVTHSQLIPVRLATPAGLRILALDEFIRLSDDTFAGPPYATTGFCERQIAAKVVEFGAIAHVFSSYESLSWDRATRFGRGINSIQLYDAEGAWRCLNIFWDAEKDGLTIPGKYLRND